MALQAMGCRIPLHLLDETLDDEPFCGNPMYGSKSSWWCYRVITAAMNKFYGEGNFIWKKQPDNLIERLMSKRISVDDIDIGDATMRKNTKIILIGMLAPNVFREFYHSEVEGGDRSHAVVFDIQKEMYIETTWETYPKGCSVRRSWKAFQKTANERVVSPYIVPLEEYKNTKSLFEEIQHVFYFQEGNETPLMKRKSPRPPVVEEKADTVVTRRKRGRPRKTQKVFLHSAATNHPSQVCGVMRSLESDIDSD